MQVLRNDLYKPWFSGEKDWGVEILDGEFSNLVVQFESIEFSKNDDGTVDINYHVINKEAFPELDTSSDLFSRTIELIINDIMKEAISSYEQTRNNDSTESS